MGSVELSNPAKASRQISAPIGTHAGRQPCGLAPEWLANSAVVVVGSDARALKFSRVMREQRFDIYVIPRPRRRNGYKAAHYGDA
jgi:hypothetical protein